MKCYSLSHVQLFATPWTVARQATLSLGFPRQEYLSELPFPSPGDLPDPGIKPTSPISPALQADSLLLEEPSLLLKSGFLITNSLLLQSLVLVSFAHSVVYIQMQE